MLIGGSSQVLQIVRTSQVTYSLLNDLEDYIQNLGKDGVLEDKLSLHLHELVQVVASAAPSSSLFSHSVKTKNPDKHFLVCRVLAVIEMALNRRKLT